MFLLEDLHITSNGIDSLFCDNQLVRDITQNNWFQEMTKHRNKLSRGLEKASLRSLSFATHWYKKPTD